MFFLVFGVRLVKLLEECKIFIECVFEVWMKNLESFFCRVYGVFFGLFQDYYYIIFDIIIWDF